MILPRKNHSGICNGYTGIYNSFHDRRKWIFKCISLRDPVRKFLPSSQAGYGVVFDVLTGVAQMMIFFLLGLLVTPSQLPQVIIPSFVIMIFLTLVGRPVSVAALLAGFRASIGQMGLVSWAGLRGVASIVFAIYVVLRQVPLGYNLFNLVFCIVLLSISIQEPCFHGSQESCR